MSKQNTGLYPLTDNEENIEMVESQMLNSNYKQFEMDYDQHSFNIQRLHQNKSGQVSIIEFNIYLGGGF